MEEVNKKNELKKELFKVNKRCALGYTTKAALVSQVLLWYSFLGLSGTALSDLLDKYVLKDYMYKDTTINSDGTITNEKIVDNEKSNSMVVYTNCLENDDKYVITYDTYYNVNVDDTVFEYIHNAEDLEKLLGEPSKNNYMISDTSIDLEKNYASLTTNEKTDIVKEYKPTKAIICFRLFVVLGWVAYGVTSKIILKKDKLLSRTNKILKYDLEEEKSKAKTLKLKLKEM